MAVWSANEIKTLRMQLGWSRADFSRRFGCELELVNEWERGEKSPSPEHQRQLEALSFSVDSIAEQTSLRPQAEQILSIHGIEQIHRDQLRSYFKN